MTFTIERTTGGDCPPPRRMELGTAAWTIGAGIRERSGLSFNHLRALEVGGKVSLMGGDGCAWTAERIA